MREEKKEDDRKIEKVEEIKEEEEYEGSLPKSRNLPGCLYLKEIVFFLGSIPQSWVFCGW